MRENALEARLGLLVAKRGGVAIKLRPPPVGIPDRLVLLPGDPGRVVFVELKSGRGRVSPAQAMWLARLTRLGYQTVTINSPIELDKWVRRELY